MGRHSSTFGSCPVIFHRRVCVGLQTGLSPVLSDTTLIPIACTTPALMRCQAENREDAALDALLSPAANAALQTHLAAAAAASAVPASKVWSPCLLLHTELGSACFALGKVQLAELLQSHLSSNPALHAAFLPPAEVLHTRALVVVAMYTWQFRKTINHNKHVFQSCSVFASFSCACEGYKA